MPRTPATASLFSKANRHAELIQRALAQVDARMDQRLTAECLADAAAMSRHHFHRVFQAHVGCSVGAYITGLRLQRACALLASGPEPVLEVALAVGYDSAQSLAKALRRELGITPSAVRRGDAAPWVTLPLRGRPARQRDPDLSLERSPSMDVTRIAHLPTGLVALTATARGMVANTMVRAARQAFGELAPACRQAAHRMQAASWICLAPDDAQGPDDPHCRYVAGVIFGHDLATGEGRCEQPDIHLSGSLAWQAIAPGRHAVFTHIGPYEGLHRTWAAIYRDWLPGSGEELRDDPPLELMRNNPETTAPQALHTEIWIPLMG